MKKLITILSLLLTLYIPNLWAMCECDMWVGSTTEAGLVELATDEETVTGTSDAVVCTPGNITAKMAAPGAIGGTTPAAGAFTTLDTGQGATELNQYKTIYIDAGALVPCTTNGALAGTYEYGTHDLDHDYYAFDAGATEERVQYKSPMPEDWDRGTVKVKFYWSSATGSTADDTCEWGVKAQAFSDSDPNDAAFGDAGEVISDVLLADNGGDAQLSDATPAVTVGGSPALSDMIVWEFYRNTDGTDDMVEDGWLKGIAIQYKATSAVAAW